jgi:hypothetical protein
LEQGLKLTALRCDTCTFQKGGFCSKIGEPLPNPIAKLFFGGADKLFSGTQTYASECGIEKRQVIQEDLSLLVFAPEENYCETLKNEE